MRRIIVALLVNLFISTGWQLESGGSGEEESNEETFRQFNDSISQK